MNYMTERDAERLSTCHPKIQAIFSVALRQYNAVVASAYRGEEEQNELYDEGKSQLQYPESKHNATDERGNPQSRAADVYPVLDDEVPWGDKRYFYHFGGYVKAVAERLGIEIRWGGDWDSDGDFGDQTFNDLGHFELADDE